MRVNIPATEAKKAGLPAVDYQVNMRGDVHASVTVGNQTVQGEIPAAVAKPAYDALGAQGQQVAQDLTRRGTEALKNAVPGARVFWQQPATHARR